MGTAVKLLWGPASLMHWTIGADANYDIDGEGDEIGIRFCVPKDGEIDRVGFYIHVFNGTPPDYQVSIETLDDAGLPSGANYGGSTPGEFTPLGVGHLWVSLEVNATATAGDFVAGVISPTEVAPDAANSIDVLSIALGDDCGVPAEVTWTIRKSIPSIAIRYTDGDVYGLSITSAIGALFDQANTPDEAGCKFSVPADMVCYGARVAFSACEANTSYEVRLYNDADAVIASVVVDDEDKANQGVGIMDVFWDEVILTADATYRLTLISTHATARIGPARLTFPDLDSRYWVPEGSRWSGTERTDEGAWTDEALEIQYMAIWVNDIDFGANGDGIEPMAGLMIG